MNARERTLAVSFLSIILVGGAFLAALNLKRWKGRIDDEEYRLQLQRMEAEHLLGEKDLWLKRAEWITAQQPEFKTRRDSDTDLNDLIKDSTLDRQIEVVQNQPSEPTELPGLFASTTLVQGSGSFLDAMGWIYDLQKPGKFVSIPSITIVPDEEDTSKVNVSLVLQKWYRKTETSS